MDTITQTNPLMWIITVIVGVIILLTIIKINANNEFDKWFEAVLNLAPHYGFNEEQIATFEEIYFYINFYAEGLTPEEALQSMKS